MVVEQLGLHCVVGLRMLRTGRTVLGSWILAGAVGRAVRALPRQCFWSAATIGCRTPLPAGRARSRLMRSRGAHSLEFEIPTRRMFTGIYAMVAARHMHEFEHNTEQLAAIAVACRSMPGSTPRARKRDANHHRGLIKSRMVREPAASARLFGRRWRRWRADRDNAGACPRPEEQSRCACWVWAKHNRATTWAFSPVPLASAATKSISAWCARCNPKPPCRRLARLITPADIDVAQLHDSFTITVLLQLEGISASARGEGGALPKAAELELGGALPDRHLWRHAVLRSHGDQWRLASFIEAARQVRGECAPSAGQRCRNRYRHQCQRRRVQPLARDPGERLMPRSVAPQPTKVSQPFWDARAPRGVHYPENATIAARICSIRSACALSARASS